MPAIRTPADLREAMRTGYTVSDQQWAAISAPLGPGVVIAGAGSGKTELMAARVIYCVVNELVRPDEVLGLTFTTKAASELRQRIQRFLDVAGFGPDEAGGTADMADGPGEPGEFLEPTVATYNAYAASLLTEHGLRIGHEPDTRVLADASRFQLAARAMSRHTAPVALLSDSPTHVTTWLLALDAALSEHLVGIPTLRAYDARDRPLFEESLAAETGKGKRTEIEKAIRTIDERAELLGLVEDYRRLKGELGLMDFSDQVALAARLVEEHPQVGAQEREKHRLVLLDEYQDTSVAQARLLSGLFSGPSAEAGQGHPVTAVGDPNQAIYGWRGASVSNIVHFGDDFPQGDGATDAAAYPLTVSRRSGRRILEAANELARPLYAAVDQVERLAPAADAGEGAVRVIAHVSYADELAWLTAEVQATYDAMPEPEWSRIGVLVRDNTHAADVFDALTVGEVPVEIVGLAGLLRLPEVAEVVATLNLLVDVTANADLLTLLTGPRWAVGPRDLALLGRRASELAGARVRRRAPGEAVPLDDELASAVAGADPADVPALADALADPGDAPYSLEARERFGLLASELAMLRRHTAEPLLELVRRIIDTCGIDVELAASVSPAAAARRDNLDLFVKAVAEFQAVDGDVTLPALMSYLQTEDEQGNSLDVATPTAANSVKLLTVHRAKGLEYDAVFLVGVSKTKFPNDTARALPTRARQVLPHPLRGDARDLPVLRGHTADDLAAFQAEAKGHEALEELRLGYVAVTRPRHLLWVSSYLWQAGKVRPLGPSTYQRTLRALVDIWPDQPVDPWQDDPPAKTANPLTAAAPVVRWPVTERTGEALRRIAGAEIVAEQRRSPGSDDALGDADRELVATWDAELDRLVEEAQAEVRALVEVPLPGSLSATALARLRDDPAAVARDLARPMPRQPSPAARFGTRFHAWVEGRFGQQTMLDPDDLPGRADSGIDDDADLETLIRDFEAGPFGDRVPVAVEPAFALVLGGQVVRGRIDAVYAEPDGSYLLVDWKTNKQETADPLQLAIYRLAWAELHGVDPADVAVAFHYVRTGRTVRPDPADLPDRGGLEALFASE